MTEIVHVDEFDDPAEIHESLGTLPPAYEEFQAGEGIPRHRTFAVDDPTALPTGAWDRTGQRGAFVNLHGANGVTDLHLHELEPNGETTRQHHLYEEIVYVLEGSGVTTVGEEETVFEWSEGALFFLPPATPYRHANATDGPARLVAQTPLPQLFNMYNREGYLFDVDPSDDVTPGKDYYAADGRLTQRESGFYDWRANFIPDVSRFEEIQPQTEMGAQIQCGVLVDDSTMGGHVADMPAGMYKTAHRHGPGATLFMLGGEGYDLLWREGWDRKVRVDWTEGSLFSPPARWYHHHFNLTDEPVRHFAAHCINLGTLNAEGNPVFYFAHPENVIPYTEEDPAVRRLFEAELDERGLESRMPEACYEDPDYELAL